MAIRVIFAGSPGIAVPCLRSLSEMETSRAGVEIAAVLTNPDSARGRKGRPEPTEVSAAAEELSAARREKGFPSIVQLKFEKLDGFSRAETAALKADLLVSFAYGRVFGPRYLGLFGMGGINIHPSLLPRYRGPSPIPAAILNRDRETGISIQKLAPEMDSGDILSRETIPLRGRETTLSLSEKVAARAAEMLPELLRRLKAGEVPAEKQTGEVVYCSLMEKAQGRINWEKSAAEIDAQVRAYTPWPLAFTRRGEETLFILEGTFLAAAPSALTKDGAGAGVSSPARPGTVLGIDRERGILIQTGNGVYAVSRLQWQAKKVLAWKDFLNGARDFAGSVLS